jgi:hypothetical protein
MRNILLSNEEYDELLKRKEKEMPECFDVKEYIFKKIRSKK